ncbi:ABC transporter substrate-binding protein [Actinokineospora iranica]|uniref:Iron complex transport system substrate-binding protein n=1 Tax=Actinokineospora iranica TaxID=1271860 RepID=A0A1G6T7N7_9PSEU|nr:ABC transporter substrate-binding protein [Actinokineospora iranica]SDD25051.1 iron complex transport system substrate-binding protein [Actinokineospora iranica]
MNTFPTRQTRRRKFLAVATGVALASVLVACGDAAPGSSNGGSSTAAAPSGPWEFTDDRGKKVSLPQRPTKIVMQVNAAATLVDFGIKPIGVFGPQKTTDGKPSPQAGDLDPNTESVGSEFGEFNLEKYTALKPELLITIMYGEALWYIPEESAATIEEKAPMVAIQLGGVSAAEGIAKFAKLAESLGADLNSADLAKAKQEFETAGAALKAAAAAKPGLKTMVVQGSKDALLVAKPDFFSDLNYFGKQGLDMVAPTGGEAPSWEELSWEQASRYPADLILNDSRDFTLPQAEMAKIPTWAELPAVKAGQLGLWHPETPMSYQKLTPVIRELASVVEKARTDVVS